MEYLVPLWKHQREIIERVKDLPYHNLFLDTGTGKTCIVINILRYKCLKEGRQLKTLALCPQVVCQTLAKEFDKHSKMGTKVHVLSGSSKKRLKDFTKAIANDPNKIFISNYEILLMPDVYAAITSWLPEFLIGDEIHFCKNISAKRTKLLVKLSKNIKYRFLLTATPCANTPMDLFSQFLILDGGETFSPYLRVFQNEYFYDANAGMPSHVHFPDLRLRPGAIERLNSKVAKVSTVIKKHDCLDLPPLVEKDIEVPLSMEQEKAYKAMSQDFIAYINGRASVATIALTKLLRLQQIISGFTVLEKLDGQGDLHVFEKTPRLAAIKDLLETLSPHHKICVWANFKENFRQLATICQSLGIGFVEVHGEISAKEKDLAVESFINDAATRVFISNPAAGGVGITLVESDVSIFYSRGYSLTHDLQAMGRNYRGGSERHAKITRINLVAPNTVDELIAKALKGKENIAGKILGEFAQSVRGMHDIK